MKGKLKILLLVIVLFLPGISFSRAIVVDVFPRKINIDHKFRGINILIYGARNDAGNIVIIVRGPKKNYVLRKKGKIAGIWTNIKKREIENMNAFYAVSSMRPLEDIQNESLMKSLQIGIDNLDYKVVTENPSKPRSDIIKKEINDLMQSKSLYTKNNYEILFWGETLFRSFVEFPKNIVRGTYHIDVYLFNDGLLTSLQTLPIIVEQVGFEAFMFDFAHSRSVLYGVLSVFLALLMGWFTSVLFKRR